MDSRPDDLKTMLADLDARMAAELRDNPDADAFWPTFAAQSDAVLEAAGPDHSDWVSSELTAMLQRYGVSVPEA